MAENPPPNIPGSPDYRADKPPSYQGVDPKVQAILDQMYGEAGQLGGFNEAFGYAQEALQKPGAYDIMSQYAPNAKQIGKYLGGAGRASEAYKKSAVGNLQQLGQEGMRNLGSMTGRAGRMGSTVQMGQIGDFGRQYAGARNDIEAQGEKMRLDELQRRMGVTLGGISAYGQAAGNQRTQDLLATQNMADLQLQANQQGFSQLGQAAGMGMMPNQMQNQWGMDMYGTNQANPSPSAWDVAASLGSAFAPYFG